MKLCADSSMVERQLFQDEDSGSIPTSALHLHFREIGSATAAKAYSQWHYLGDQNFLSQINFGAYWQGKMEGAITFGSPNATDLAGYWDRNTQGEWWEIKRLVMSPLCPKNSESRFIAITIKMLRKMAIVKGIVTYADDGQGHQGAIYKASGFKSLGMTAAKKDFWVNGKVQQRGKTKGMNGEWRDRSRKWLFIKDFRKQTKPNNYEKTTKTIPPQVDLFDPHF